MKSSMICISVAMGFALSALHCGLLRAEKPASGYLDSARIEAGLPQGILALIEDAWADDPAKRADASASARLLLTNTKGVPAWTRFVFVVQTHLVADPDPYVQLCALNESYNVAFLLYKFRPELDAALPEAKHLWAAVQQQANHKNPEIRKAARRFVTTYPEPLAKPNVR